MHKVVQKPLVNAEGQKMREQRTGPTAETLAGHTNLFLALPQISFLDSGKPLKNLLIQL